MSEENIFAIVIPSEASLQAPIAPATELSKLYIIASQKLQQLAEQTRVRRETDSNGNERVIVTDHPDLKWWFDQLRKIGSEIGKLIKDIETKNVEHKLKVLDLFLTNPNIPEELREEYTRRALEEKVLVNERNH